MAADRPDSSPDSEAELFQDSDPKDSNPEDSNPEDSNPELAQLAGETLELADVLNTALDKGVILHGDVTIAVADVDLIKLNLGLLLGAIDTVNRHSGRPGSGEGDEPVGNANRQQGTGRSRPTLAGTFGPPLLDPVPPVSDVSPTSSAQPSFAPATHVPATPPSSASPPLTAPVSAPHQETSLNAVAQGLPHRINAEAPGVESGLARLVLTLIEVLRKVLEHQAVRRMDGGKLSAEEIERLGLALSRLNYRMDELKNVFGLTDDDLQIDLGPLGRVR